jgi:hypothetical protein
MFGRSRRAKEKAISFLTDNLQTQLTVYLNTGVLISAIENDPYIAGYIQGKIVSALMYFVKAEGMAVSDMNEASGQVLLNVFGRNQASEVSAAMKNHAGLKSRQYETGHEKGVLIAYYVFGAKDVKQDREYTAAINTYRDAERSLEGLGLDSGGVDENMKAICGLEMLWFSKLLSSS